MALARQWVSRELYRSDTTVAFRWKVLVIFPLSTHWTAVDTRPRMRILVPPKVYFLHWRSVNFMPRDRTRS